MKFPNFENKCGFDSMIEPQRLLSYRKEIGTYPSFDVPKGVIFIYQKSLFKYITENHAVTKVSGFGDDMYLLGDSENRIAIIGKFGIGAPAVIIKLEELIAFGVKNFISVGTAGTLQKNIPIGSIMVCDRAIRDEGTSHHYVKPSKYSYASKEMTDKIITAFREKNIEFFVGTSWTIDAPYRETIAEAKAYQSEGVSTVDMEASALFAVSDYRKVNIGSIFSISDSLAELEWNPQMCCKETNDSLELMYKIALEVLGKE